MLFIYQKVRRGIRFDQSTRLNFHLNKFNLFDNSIIVTTERGGRFLMFCKYQKVNKTFYTNLFDNLDDLNFECNEHTKLKLKS